MKTAISVWLVPITSGTFPNGFHNFPPDDTLQLLALIVIFEVV